MEKITNRFGFDPAKVDAVTWWIMAGVWLVVAGCAVGSVIAQRHHLTRQQKVKWILAIVCVPVVGLLAYLPYSVIREGPGVLRQSKRKKKGVSAS